MRYLALSDSVTPCPYLPDREFIAENFIAPSLRPDEMDTLLRSGYRHFGSYFFRPVCGGCSRCVPLRVIAGNHTNSRSERRLMNINRELVVTAGAPAPNKRAYQLYRMHQQRFEVKSPATYERFCRSFFAPTSGNTQISVYLNGLLISVLHLDVTGTSVSAVYCYYDTRFEKRSLGTFSVLKGLHFAGKLKVEHFYLGYIVSGNRHMEYKMRFRPNEFLSSAGWIFYKAADGTTDHTEEYERGFPGDEYRKRGAFPDILSHR